MKSGHQKSLNLKRRSKLILLSFCLNLLNLVHSSKRRLKYSLRANRKKKSSTHFLRKNTQETLFAFFSRRLLEISNWSLHLLKIKMRSVLKFIVLIYIMVKLVFACGIICPHVDRKLGEGREAESCKQETASLIKNVAELFSHGKISSFLTRTEVSSFLNFPPSRRSSTPAFIHRWLLFSLIN